MLRVLQVPRHSNLVYQDALLQSELSDIFERAPKAATGIQAKQEVVKAYKKTLGVDDEEEEEVAVVASVNEKVAEGDCPVCFEDLPNGEALHSCATCRNYIHADCLKMWLAVQKTCCYCREEWVAFGATKPTSSTPAAAAASEGYVNLGAIQGLSGRRDTSTYNSYHYGYGGYRRGYRGYDHHPDYQQEDEGDEEEDEEEEELV